jgi:hypothetical protein
MLLGLKNEWPKAADKKYQVVDFQQLLTWERSPIDVGF